jgi:hypothetical protein
MTIAERFAAPSVAVGDLSPDDLRARIEALVDDAGDHGHGRWNLESAISDWISESMDGAWARWPCDDDGCPGRPAWDLAMSEAWNRLHKRLNRDLERTIRHAIVKELVAFAAAHPDARLSLPEALEAA